MLHAANTNFYSFWLDQTVAPTPDLPLEVNTLTIVPLMGFIWQEHVTFDEMMFMSALY